jgi:predicted kinase
VVPELVILIGLQGAGKSTFCRTRFQGTHDWVSKDRFRNNRRPARRQRQLIEEALQAGRSVVVDNTNPTTAERAELIALGRAFGARVVSYYFASRLEDCLERNRTRAGKERVPDVAVYATAKRLQVPSVDDGFDHLYWVRLRDGGQFDVQQWQEGQAAHDA